MSLPLLNTHWRSKQFFLFKNFKLDTLQISQYLEFLIDKWRIKCIHKTLFWLIQMHLMYLGPLILFEGAEKQKVAAISCEYHMVQRSLK